MIVCLHEYRIELSKMVSR